MNGTIKGLFPISHQWTQLAGFLLYFGRHDKPVLAVTYDPADQGFFKTGDAVGVDFSAPASHILA